MPIFGAFFLVSYACGFQFFSSSLKAKVAIYCAGDLAWHEISPSSTAIVCRNVTSLPPPLGGGVKTRKMEFSSQNFHFNLRSHNQSLKKRIPKSEKCHGSREFPFSCSWLSMYGPKMAEKMPWILDFWTRGHQKFRNWPQKVPISAQPILNFSQIPREFSRELNQDFSTVYEHFLAKKNPHYSPAGHVRFIFARKVQFYPRHSKFMQVGVRMSKMPQTTKKNRNWSFRPKFVLCFSASQRNLFVTNKVV